MSQPEKKARPRERGQKYALTYSGDDDDDDDEKGIDRGIKEDSRRCFKKKAREVYMSVCVCVEEEKKEGRNLESRWSEGVRSTYTDIHP